MGVLLLWEEAGRKDQGRREVTQTSLWLALPLPHLGQHKQFILDPEIHGSAAEGANNKEQSSGDLSLWSHNIHPNIHPRKQAIWLVLLVFRTSSLQSNGQRLLKTQQSADHMGTNMAVSTGACV